jgi:hypothetical protein
LFRIRSLGDKEFRSKVGKLDADLMIRKVLMKMTILRTSLIRGSFTIGLRIAGNRNTDVNAELQIWTKDSNISIYINNITVGTADNSHCNCGLWGLKNSNSTKSFVRRETEGFFKRIWKRNVILHIKWKVKRRSDVIRRWESHVNLANWRSGKVPKYGQRGSLLTRFEHGSGNVRSLSKKGNTFKNTTVDFGGSDLSGHHNLCKRMDMNTTDRMANMVGSDLKIEDSLNWKFTVMLCWQKEYLWK